MEVILVLVVVGKHDLAIMPALNYMMEEVRQKDAGGAGHDGSINKTEVS